MPKPGGKEELGAFEDNHNSNNSNLLTLTICQVLVSTLEHYFTQFPTIILQSGKCYHLHFIDEVTDT